MYGLELFVHCLSGATFIVVTTARAMAPKNARLALEGLVKPQATAAPARQQASLHTIEVTIDEIQLDGDKGQAFTALRLVIADGNSVAAGRAAQYHGLNTFVPRCLSVMTLPDIPKD